MEHLEKRDKFVELITESGFQNKKLANEWYRSQSKTKRDTTTNELLVVEFLQSRATR